MKSLSEKRKVFVVDIEKGGEVDAEIYYLEEDVKEAVKRLKEATLRLHCETCNKLLLEEIDEIFGDKLTGKEEKWINKN